MQLPCLLCGVLQPAWHVHVKPSCADPCPTHHAQGLGCARPCFDCAVCRRGCLPCSAPVWAVIVAHFCFNWGYYTLLAWLPSYFEMALGELAIRSCQHVQLGLRRCQWLEGWQDCTEGVPQLEQALPYAWTGHGAELPASETANLCCPCSGPSLLASLIHLSLRCLAAAGLNVEKSSLLTLIPYISMTVMTPFVGPIAGAFLAASQALPVSCWLLWLLQFDCRCTALMAAAC